MGTDQESANALADDGDDGYADRTGNTHKGVSPMRSLSAGIKLAGMVCLIVSLTVASPDSLLADASGVSAEEGTGIKVAGWAATVPYCLAKSTFAALGGIVGGFAYVLSGGNAETAKAVWTTSILGTYIIRPEHLRGEEPIHFLGRQDDDEEPSSPAVKSSPAK